MMTVAESELVRRAAEKGRSASFCVPGPPMPSTLTGAHSSQELADKDMVVAKALMQIQHDIQQSPRTRLKAAQARRSQSCRVQGSRPRVKRRDPSPQGSLSAPLDQEDVPERGEPAHNASYNPFLKKMSSCGRLVALAPDEGANEVVDDSPVLRRSASARRPRPAPLDSPEHSPTPPRQPRHPPQKGRSSTKRGKHGGSRKSGAGSGFLEVKSEESSETLDTDAYLLRNFCTTNKGEVINRGDSFRRRRSRSNSVQPPQLEISLSASTILASQHGGATSPSLDPSPVPPASPETNRSQSLTPCPPTTGASYYVAIVGAPGVGKTALIHQFRTSECINAYDCSATGDETEQNVSIVLNNIESEIVFINADASKDIGSEREKLVWAWVVLYSITDRASFQRASEELERLQSLSLLRSRAVVLVANKCELVRSRAVSVDDGREMACSYGGKFMEISVGMNHKCDELLVGITNQVRLKEEAMMEAEAAGTQEKERSPWTRNRSLMRASRKAKRVLNRIMGKSDAKYKSCEDFQN